MATQQHGIVRQIRFWVVFFLWQYWFAVGFFGIGLLLWAASSFGWTGYAALAAALAGYYASISGSKAHTTSKGDKPDSRLHDTFSEDFAEYFGGMPVSVAQDHIPPGVSHGLPHCYADRVPNRG